MCEDRHDRRKLFNDGEVHTEIRNVAGYGLVGLNSIPGGE
jgi:hypothetical protein